MLALLKKYSSDDSNDTLVFHPSLFDLIKDDSSESGYPSKQVSSTSNDCSDSDWQVSQVKDACARSGEPASDIVSCVSQSHDAHHQCRPNLNYITDSLRCAIIITTGKKSSSLLSGGCAIVITTGKKKF